ncbi:MAG: ClpXP protease specificity-enhancing factor SspB [Alphaproteobacteria bacterium]
MKVGKMSETDIPYDHMVESALRQVVRDALSHAEEYGLQGEHHFYITFRTDHGYVDIPDYLIDRYPEEMTIVLQHQFFGLEVHDSWFEVSLSFDNVPEQLVIPFGAVTVFADPSVSFALQFEPDWGDEDEGGGGPKSALTKGESKEQRQVRQGKVVELDAWRRR